MLGARIVTFSPMLFVLCKVTKGSWWEVWGQKLPWMMYSPYWMSTITMSRPWVLWIRSSFSYAWVKRDSIGWGDAPVKTPAGPHGVIPGTFSSRPCTQAEVWLFLWWLPKQLKAMVAYLKASTNEKTYSDYLSGQWGRLGRKRQWSHLVAKLPITQVSQRSWVSSPYES